MDRLRQEFQLIEMPGLRESGDSSEELLSLMEALREYEPPQHSFQKATKNITPFIAKGKLALLVKNVQGADPKRWARRIEKRISEGDESVTLLQKQAARSALR